MVLLTPQLDYHGADGSQSWDYGIPAKEADKRHALLREGTYHICHSLKLLTFGGNSELATSIPILKPAPPRSLCEWGCGHGWKRRWRWNMTQLMTKDKGRAQQRQAKSTLLSPVPFQVVRLSFICSHRARVSLREPEGLDLCPYSQWGYIASRGFRKTNSGFTWLVRNANYFLLLA